MTAPQLGRFVAYQPLSGKVFAVRPPTRRRDCQAGHVPHLPSQELLGHQDVSTTMIDTHVLNRGPAGVRSPADRMFLS
jgi:hypothetical protein